MQLITPWRGALVFADCWLCVLFVPSRTDCRMDIVWVWNQLSLSWSRTFCFTIVLLFDSLFGEWCSSFQTQIRRVGCHITPPNVCLWFALLFSLSLCLCQSLPVCLSLCLSPFPLPASRKQLTTFVSLYRYSEKTGLIPIEAESPDGRMLDALLSNRWRHLPSTKHIELPDALHWLNMPSSMLFVRHFYDDLISGVFGDLDVTKLDKYNKFILLGTPGIGIFLLFFFDISWFAVAHGFTCVLRQVLFWLLFAVSRHAIWPHCGVSLSQVVARTGGSSGQMFYF